ncbi:MAG TPA: hypothetical protein ENF25_02725 [Thermoprotei archaeon]|nr:hypothetical protein [Thermoprotei archaeon]
MLYVSYEVETMLYESDMPEILEKYRDLIYKTYDDPSVCTEVVTKPLTYEDLAVLSEFLERVYGLQDELADENEVKMRTSLHTTFTQSKKRDVSMHQRFIKCAIRNAIKYYTTIIYLLCHVKDDYDTRGTYFRYYYVSYHDYQESKDLYPAVFCPNYDYNDLPIYHKVEWRIPDSPIYRPSAVIDYYIILKAFTVFDFTNKGKNISKKEIAINKKVAKRMHSRDVYYLPDILEEIPLADALVEKQLKELIDMTEKKGNKRFRQILKDALDSLPSLL